MKSSTKIQLELMPAERDKLRANRIKIKDIQKYSVDKLSEILKVPTNR